MESNSANGRLLTLSTGKRQGTFYCHSINDGKHKISRDLATGVAAQGAGGGLATCDYTQSVCTEGTLSRSATRFSSGGTEGPSSLASPYRGVILQPASHNWRRRKNVGVSNAELIKLPHMMQQELAVLQQLLLLRRLRLEARMLPAEPSPWTRMNQ